jgi:hypothetical protein
MSERTAQIERRTGETSVSLRLALDGSGARTPIGDWAEPVSGRLPRDLRFSPDGQHLAFSTSFHLSACASTASYYVTNADGTGLTPLISPSLNAVLDPAQEFYHMGFSYAWKPASDGLAVTGLVRDCTLGSSNEGQIIAGPQLSLLNLDGTEGLVIPGDFHSVSFDPRGQWIGVARSIDPSALTANVEILSAQNGQVVLDLGQGQSPQFQP